MQPQQQAKAGAVQSGQNTVGTQHEQLVLLTEYMKKHKQITGKNKSSLPVICLCFFMYSVSRTSCSCWVRSLLCHAAQLSNCLEETPCVQHVVRHVIAMGNELKHRCALPMCLHIMSYVLLTKYCTCTHVGCSLHKPHSAPQHGSNRPYEFWFFTRPNL